MYVKRRILDGIGIEWHGWCTEWTGEGAVSEFCRIRTNVR
jgi:hypothetical protein